MEKKLTDEQESQVINLYRCGKSCYQLGVQFGSCDGTIRNILIRRGIPRRSLKDAFAICHRKDFFNEKYFDLIETEEQAYWLGFFVAEGNIHKYTGSISLGAKDKYHLLKFKEAINSNYDLDYRESKNAYRIRFNSSHTVKSLRSLGVIPKKSHFIKTPPISPSLLRHFFRGFFFFYVLITKKERVKKDGSVSSYYEIGFASCCYDFLSELREWVRVNTRSNHGSLFKRKNCCQLSFSGNRLVLQVCELLYKNANFYLERKKLRFDSLKEVNCGKESLVPMYR